MSPNQRKRATCVKVSRKNSVTLLAALNRPKFSAQPKQTNSHQEKNWTKCNQLPNCHPAVIKVYFLRQRTQPNCTEATGKKVAKVLLSVNTIIRRIAWHRAVKKIILFKMNLIFISLPGILFETIATSTCAFLLHLLGFFSMDQSISKLSLTKTIPKQMSEESFFENEESHKNDDALEGSKRAYKMKAAILRILLKLQVHCKRWFILHTCSIKYTLAG